MEKAVLKEDIHLSFSQIQFHGYNSDQHEKNH